MASFEMNLTKVKEDLDALNQYIKNYNETISAVKTTLSNADSFWNDFNTDPFIKTIDNDEKKFKNHINAISNYVAVVENFCDDLKQCIFKYIGEAKVIKIKYNSININLAIQDLDKAILFFYTALVSLKSMNIPLTFKYRPVLNAYEKDLKNHIKTLSFSKTTLENINRTIINILATTKTKNARIEFQIIDNKKLGYRWKTFSNDLKQIEKENNKEYITDIANDDNKIELIDITDPVIMFNEGIIDKETSNKIDSINIEYHNKDTNFVQESLNDNLYAFNIGYSNKEKTISSTIENRDLNLSNNEININNKDIEPNINNQMFQNINYKANVDNKKTNEVDGIENLE